MAINPIVNHFIRVVKVATLSCVMLTSVLISNHLAAQDASEIANEIAEIKKEVLKLNRELFILEEDLLFPASTQVAVFVSVDIGRFFSLDSVELKLNNEEVAGFLYTLRQRQSLEQGGIQRLFKGNIKTGSHELTAIFIGIDQEQRRVKRAITYQFEKEDDAVMIELKLEDNTRKFQTEVKVEEWIL
ncbi:MAG: AraC family transcriptional regulator [Thalassotalea sp.]